MLLRLEEQDEAVELLKSVLMSSLSEGEYDKDIYDFLLRIGEVPQGFIPYFEEEGDIDNE